MFPHLFTFSRVVTSNKLEHPHPTRRIQLIVGELGLCVLDWKLCALGYGIFPEFGGFGFCKLWFLGSCQTIPCWEWIQKVCVGIIVLSMEKMKNIRAWFLLSMKIWFSFSFSVNYLAGQKTANNPSVMLASLLSRRAKLQDELRGIEKQVHFFYIFF